MKKNILFICILAIMNLITACGSSKTETAEYDDEFRQELESLEERISVLEQDKDKAKAETEAEVKVEVEEKSESEAESELQAETGAETDFMSEVGEETEVESEIATEIPVQIEDYLNSDNPDDWLQVAQSDSATGEELLTVADKCATLNYYVTDEKDEKKQLEITAAILNNQASTDAIRIKLLDSRFLEVWKAIASSDSSETVLVAVAQKCSAIDTNATYQKDEEQQLEVASILFENPSSTYKVMCELKNSQFPSVVDIFYQWAEEHS